MDAGPAYAGTGYVAADELGAEPNPEWFSDEFHRLAAAAGVPRIRLHDGRHTVNSLMAAAGVPPHIRAAWCGHSEAVNATVWTSRYVTFARFVLAGKTSLCCEEDGSISLEGV